MKEIMLFTELMHPYTFSSVEIYGNGQNLADAFRRLNFNIISLKFWGDDINEIYYKIESLNICERFVVNNMTFIKMIYIDPSVLTEDIFTKSLSDIYDILIKKTMSTVYAHCMSASFAKQLNKKEEYFNKYKDIMNKHNLKFLLNTYIISENYYNINYLSFLKLALRRKQRKLYRKLNKSKHLSDSDYEIFDDFYQIRRATEYTDNRFLCPCCANKNTSNVFIHNISFSSTNVFEDNLEVECIATSEIEKNAHHIIQDMLSQSRVVSSEKLNDFNMLSCDELMLIFLNKLSDFSELKQIKQIIQTKLLNIKN